MALSTKELNTLLTLLSEDSLKSSNMEQLGSSFHRTFMRSDHFRAGMALTVLLQEKDLLPLTMQRVAAIFLLHETHKPEPLSSNPFGPFLAELLQPHSEEGVSSAGHSLGCTLDQVEKAFLAQLAAPNQPRDFLKRTPFQIASMDPTSIQTPDITSLLTTLQSSLRQISEKDKVGRNCILSDPDITATHQHDPTSASQTAEVLLSGADVPSLEPFEPGLIRPAPPLHLCADEVTWLNPTDGQYSIQWDINMCNSSVADADVLKMMTRATAEALSTQEQESLVKQIQADSKLVYQCVTPSKLPNLVENNPLIAYEALLQLMSSSQISEYLQALVKMEMSLHSMEVVNRLTTAVDLPSEFIHLYITNCIQTCHNTKDKFMKSRLVRLACVFLQSLIRNKIIKVEEHSVEIQQFCVEFSQIKEATSLFKLLKNMENPDGGKSP